MNGKNYFEEIGLWPRSHNVAWMYVTGFVLSLLLTLFAYAVAQQHAGSQEVIIGTIVVAAILQFVVQMYCFLHISGAASSRERLFALAFATLLMSILVIGSLWIMFSLQGRMMPDPAQMEQYMNDQGGF